MPNQKTRQRQGRDFPVHNHLQNTEMAVEGNYNNIDGIINGTPNDDEQKKSMLERLAHYKAEAKRNATPIDGHEPTPPSAEKARC